jgi:hypothetical protein
VKLSTAAGWQWDRSGDCADETHQQRAKT